jgi:hypothetical protein
MSKLIIAGTTIQGRAWLWFILAALLVVNTTCNRQSSDPRVSILEEQTKMLMIVEAQQGFNDLFKTSFNPDKTELLLGADLQKWFQEKKKSLDSLPEPIRTAIANNQGAGLLIHDGLPPKTGGSGDVVYLRPNRFGVRRFFVRLNVDPCSDGNPATCEFCTGCSGESSPGGIIKTCVCTMGCDCHPCPGC